MQGGFRRGTTPYDLRWPATREFTQIISTFSSSAVEQMLGVVWKGYQKLEVSFLSKIDVSLADEELERSITQVLEPSIRDCLSGDEAYDIQHGPYEYATRARAPAQPPQYDIAFVVKTNRKVMWPLEAKVLKTPKNVSAYIKDIKNEYLTGRYAPYTSSAAMIGYLLRGDISKVPEHIEHSLGVKLEPHTSFSPTFSHHFSHHVRTFSDPDLTSGAFQCHHLIMPMWSGEIGEGSSVT